MRADTELAPVVDARVGISVASKDLKRECATREMGEARPLLITSCSMGERR
jgi:hypothetical protein